MSRVIVGAVGLSIAVLAPLGSPVSPAVGAAPEDRHPERFVIEVVSSAPDQVSGGDALVEVALPAGVAAADVRIELNGTDVTGHFAPQAGASLLVGLVEGMPEGRSTLTVESTARGAKPPSARLRLTNHPIGGPIFSGPQQQPFVCTTARATFDGRKLLGQPTRRQPGSVRHPRRRRSARRHLSPGRAGLSDGRGGDRRLERQLLPPRPGTGTSIGRPMATSAGSTIPPRCPPTSPRRRRSTARPCRSSSAGSGERSTASSTAWPCWPPPRSRRRRSPTTRSGTGDSCSASRAASPSGTSRGPRAPARCCPPTCSAPATAWCGRAAPGRAPTTTCRSAARPR